MNAFFGECQLWCVSKLKQRLKPLNSHLEKKNNTKTINTQKKKSISSNYIMGLQSNINNKAPTSSGKSMVALWLVTLVILWWKYSLQEARTERCVLKLAFPTWMVKSQRKSCCLCSFRHWRRLTLCTADWKVNTGAQKTHNTKHLTRETHQLHGNSTYQYEFNSAHVQHRLLLVHRS